MKKLLTTLLSFLLIIFVAYAQGEEGEKEIRELDRKGGFQDIKLNTDISLYPGLKEKKNIKDEYYPGAVLYVNERGHYETIGNVEIKTVEVKTYKGKIYEIIVILDKDPKIYQGLVKNFGETKYNIRKKAYYWATEDIRLYFRPEGKSHLALEYYSYIQHRERKKEMRKKYTDVADDF